MSFDTADRIPEGWFLKCALLWEIIVKKSLTFQSALRMAIPRVIEKTGLLRVNGPSSVVHARIVLRLFDNQFPVLEVPQCAIRYDTAASQRASRTCTRELLLLAYPRLRVARALHYTTLHYLLIAPRTGVGVRAWQVPLRCSSITVLAYSSWSPAVGRYMVGQLSLLLRFTTKGQCCDLSSGPARSDAPTLKVCCHTCLTTLR